MTISDLRLGADWYSEKREAMGWALLSLVYVILDEDPVLHVQDVIDMGIKFGITCTPFNQTSTTLPKKR